MQERRYTSARHARIFCRTIIELILEGCRIFLNLLIVGVVSLESAFGGFRINILSESVLNDSMTFLICRFFSISSLLRILMLDPLKHVAFSSERLNKCSTRYPFPSHNHQSII